MFNKKSRIENSLKASTLGIINQIISIVMSFAYRTAFLYVLSVEYLGLNGLFTDILGLLSLAELGIGTAIIYRLYEPVCGEDNAKVGKIMNFYKTVYRVVALVVAALGLLIMPFLQFFINDASEIPADVNIYLIYSLFLVQTLSTYLFSYKQSLLTVDQHGQTVSLFNMLCNIAKNVAMLAVLFATKNYLFTLVASIIIQLLSNYVFSLFISKKYKEVFATKEKLDKEEKKIILRDTSALMLHKVGYVALSSTDRIVITAFVGLGVGGIYSNYTLIVAAINLLVAQIMSNLMPSIGNLIASKDLRRESEIFDKILFLNLWITSFCAVGMFALFQPFIIVWQSVELTLPTSSVLWICLNFFLLSSKGAVGAFINTSGLFVKDRLRPLIESALNIVVSIALVRVIGLNGVFVGTFVSCVATSLWREPYILSKYHFKEKFFAKYWAKYLGFFLLMAMTAAAMLFLTNLLPNSAGYFVLKLLIVAVGTNLIFALATCWTKEFKSYARMAKNICRKIFCKSKNV
ncbi:MAG: hypothetical protein RSB61_01420 [Clostridia bacterium]